MADKETPFRELVDLCRSLEATRSRKEKISLIADFLRSLSKEEVEPALLLLTGRILPETSQRALGIGYQTVKKVLEASSHQKALDLDLDLYIDAGAGGVREVTILDVTRRLGRIAGG